MKVDIFAILTKSRQFSTVSNLRVGRVARSQMWEFYNLLIFASRQPLRKLHGGHYSGVYVIFVVVTHRLKKFTVYIFDFLFRWLAIGVHIYSF